MFTIERIINNELTTIEVTDTIIKKANKEARYWGYLPYELTRDLYNFNKGKDNISSYLSKVWNITNKGNITIRNQNKAITSDYQYFAIPIFAVITYLEDKGFKIEITYEGYGYKWRLFNYDNECIDSSYNEYLNDYFYVICDIIESYISYENEGA